MGNTCKPMAVSFQCMTKFTTNKKKKKKALIIITNYLVCLFTIPLLLRHKLHVAGALSDLSSSAFLALRLVSGI